MLYLIPIIHLILLQILQIKSEKIDLNNYTIIKNRNIKKYFFLFIHNLLHIYIIYGGIFSNTILHLIICIIILMSWILFDKCLLNNLHLENKNEIYKDTIYYLKLTEKKYVYLFIIIIILIDILILINLK